MKNLLLLVCLLIGMATTMSFTAPLPASSETTTIDARTQGSISWNIEGGGSAYIIINGGILVSGASGTGTITYNEGSIYSANVVASDGHILESSNISYNDGNVTITAKITIPKS